MSYTEINTLAELVHDYRDKCISFHDKYLVSGPEEKVQVGQAWAETARSALEFQLWLLQQTKQAKQSSIKLPVKTQEAIDEHLRVPSFDDEIVRLSNSVNQTKDALKSAKVPFQASINDFFRAKGFGKAQTPSASPSSGANAPQSSAGVTRPPLVSRDPNARVTRSSGLAPARSTAFDPPTGRVTRSSAANAPANKLPGLKSPAVRFPAASTASKPSKTVPAKRTAPASNTEKSFKQGARPEYDSNDESLTLFPRKKASSAKPATPAPGTRRSTRARSSVNYAASLSYANDEDDDDSEASEENKDATDDPFDGEAGIVHGDAIYTDDDGLIHVGSQDISVITPGISSVSIGQANFTLAENLGRTQLTDIKKVGIDAATFKEIMDHIKHDFETSFIQHSEDRVKRYCDYTGLKLFWSVGPRTPSIEAFYNHTMHKGKICYHAPPNVGLISRTLNFTKCTSGALMLPLASAWMKTMKEHDFHIRTSKAAWIMNALGNLTFLDRQLGNDDSHKLRTAERSTWSVNKQRSVLEACRTGGRTAFVDEILRESRADKSPRQLLMQDRVSSHTLSEYNAFHSTHIQTTDWDAVYLSLVQIARRYGLSELEFETFCTMPQPQGTKTVFFPYHVLARPQALVVGWDWHLLHQTAMLALRTMRRNCNRHAEAAGLGEPEVDPFIYIYWTCHHVCDRIQKVKIERP
ncbi:hypothetical protein NW753_006635 [Fusarium oxysporum]|nr:hypothetical protein NW753_006635 [Fusarium oxysporum]